jgi:hypothetical protein
LNASTGQPYARVVPDILVEVEVLTRRPGSQSTQNTSCTTSEDSVAATFIRASCMPTRMTTRAATVSPPPLLSIPRRVDRAKRFDFGSEARKPLRRLKSWRSACRFLAPSQRLPRRLRGPLTKALIQGIQPGLGDRNKWRLGRFLRL